MLKIAVWTEAWAGIPVAQECLDDVRYAVQMCRELGHAMTAEHYAEAINCVHHVGRVLQSDIDQYDLILSPMLCQLQVRKGYLAMQGKFIDFRERVAKYDFLGRDEC